MSAPLTRAELEALTVHKASRAVMEMLHEVRADQFELSKKIGFLTAERATLAAQVAEMREVLKTADATIWDSHYGGGITADHARAVSGVIHKTLALPATEAEQRARAGAEAPVLDALKAAETALEDILQGRIVAGAPEHEAEIRGPLELVRAALRAAKEATDGKA